MGMFDIIGGEQVKCFYIPHFSNNNLWYSGGALRYYEKNQKVPYRTSWYNYTKNFNILIINTIFEKDEFDKVIIIRNGRFKKIENLINTTDNDWKNIERCISYSGKWLKIKTKEDAIDFIAEYKRYNKDRTNYIKTQMPYQREHSKLLFGVLNLTKEEKQKRLTKCKELEPKVQKEIESLNIYQEELSKNTIDKYILVKPKNVIKRETIASYKHAIKMFNKTKP